VNEVNRLCSTLFQKGREKWRLGNEGIRGCCVRRGDFKLKQWKSDREEDRAGREEQREISFQK